MKIDVVAIKKIRETTGASVSDIRNALDEAKGDSKKALELLRKRGIERADKKATREVKVGFVFAYAHHTGQLGVVVALACETDFVAKTDDFQKLGKEIALQIAATQPEDIKELLATEYIRDAGKTTQDVIKEVIGKLGENIQVTDFKIVKV